MLTVGRGSDFVAFPFSALSERFVLEAEVDGAPVVAFWQPGTLSTLDRSAMSGSRDVGSAGASSPILDASV